MNKKIIIFLVLIFFLLIAPVSAVYENEDKVETRYVDPLTRFFNFFKTMAIYAEKANYHPGETVNMQMDASSWNVQCSKAKFVVEIYAPGVSQPVKVLYDWVGEINGGNPHFTGSASYTHPSTETRYGNWKASTYLYCVNSPYINILNKRISNAYQTTWGLSKKEDTCTAGYIGDISCRDGDRYRLYRYENCNREWRLVEDCENRPCNYGVCLSCEPEHHHKLCYPDEKRIWYIDACGKRVEVALDCGNLGKTCERGRDVCVEITCEPEASTKCHSGNVHWVDSCDNLGDLKEDCMGNGCEANACITKDEECEPDFMSKPCPEATWDYYNCYWIDTCSSDCMFKPEEPCQGAVWMEDMCIWDESFCVCLVEGKEVDHCDGATWMSYPDCKWDTSTCEIPNDCDPTTCKWEFGNCIEGWKESEYLCTDVDCANMETTSKSKCEVIDYKLTDYKIYAGIVIAFVIFIGLVYALRFRKRRKR